jgi:GntR family transcriptional repressor for pyruvate dehydrogenase complex
VQRFKALKPTKTYAEIVDQISSHIESGELKPGDRLPSERTLSDTLNIGRQSLREALSVLEAMGLIEVKHGIGTFVRLDALACLPMARKEDLNADNPFDFLEARRVVETEMASLAAKRATAAEIEEMEKTLAELLADTTGGKREYELDRRFHLAVARGAHNDILYRTMLGITEQMSTHLWRVMKERSIEGSGWGETFAKEHEAILWAVKSGDHKGAAHAMQAHLKSIERSFLRK